MKKLISIILCLTLCIGVLPAAAFQAFAADSDTYSISDGYIKVDVAKNNGGFAISTLEGDRLKKSDNNKALLYHSGEYDTSFVSFQVTDADGNNPKDYIFGGKYGALTDSSRNGVSVTQAANGDIISVWSTEDYGGQIVFTQTITLPNESSNEHGMVSIGVKAERISGEPVKVQTRILLDTAMGSSDYGYYRVTDKNADTTTISTEKVIATSADYPMQNFYAVDALGAPSVSSYTVSPIAPYQAAFGHWNSLAASLFDFAPDSSIDFTDPYNTYLTNDSAYALYYHMTDGDVAISEGGFGNLQTFYGIYSHRTTPDSNAVAIDVTAPGSLSLNEEKTDFIRLSETGIADFSANLNLTNLTDADFGNILLTVSMTQNLRPLNDAAAEMAEYPFGSFKDLDLSWSTFAAQGHISKTLYFEAKIPEKAAYEKISFSVYSGTQALSENLLGTKSIYLLLPGNDGDVPKLHFTSMTPDIVYKSGTRNLYLGVSNAGMLDDRSKWSMYAYPAGTGAAILIPHSCISVEPSKDKMTVAIPDDIQLALGSWYLQLEWTEAAVSADLCGANERYLTSPDMSFTVSEDIKYKNDAYGVLCIVQEKIDSVSPQYKYSIQSFLDEEEFKSFSDDSTKYEEILLVIRGEFTRKIAVEIDDPDNKDAKIKHGVFYEALSSKSVVDGKTVVDNPITINGCLDYEGGTMQVYYANTDVSGYKDSEIRVEFLGSDGELFASDSRNSIWKGVAALTAITQGSDFSLRPYDKNGNRKNMKVDEQTIKLVWPCYTGPAQMISGLVFKLAYAELGKMLDGSTELGRVLSFSASMKLPLYSSEEGCDMYSSSTYWEKIKNFQSLYKEGDSLYDYVMGPAQIANNVDQYNQLNDTAVKNKQVQAAVMVQDVLFGCGQGLVGMNFSVGVSVKNVVKDMADINAEIKINTINDWAFGVKGNFKIQDYKLQAEFSFKSKNNVPVPDNFSVFVGGFEPGWNIDGCGTVWITGGGGGISNLYDTIFCTQGIPPLKLTLTIAFDIVKVMSGTASASIGPRGFSLQAQDLKIAKTNITVIKRVGLGLEWYPAINLNASVVVDLFQGVIYGGGYIVLTTDTNYKNVFFEMFARAQVKVPTSIPLIGGMAVAGVDLGISTERIWGAAEFIGIPFGIVYYWGDDSVGLSAGSKAQPTFPNLLGTRSVPVGFDQEVGETLYLCVGTNVEPVAAGNPELLKGVQLLSVSDAWAKSDAERTIHKFNLGTFDSADAGLVQLSFTADSIEDAKAKANAFTIKNGAADWGLKLYDDDKDDAYNASANANVSFDDATGDANLAFSATDASKYNKDWTVETNGVPAEILLYNVVKPAEVTSVSGALSGNDIKLTWEGSGLGTLDSISFFLTTQSDADFAMPDGDSSVANIDPGYLIYTANTAAEISSGQKNAAIPADLPSGSYYVRAVYSQKDTVNGVVYSTSPITYTNANTPSPLTAPVLTPAGDLRFSMSLDDASAAKITGYLVTIYEENGNASDFAGMSFAKAASGNTSITIGGSYTGKVDHDNDLSTPDIETSFGLKAGTTYYAEITPYNEITDASGEKHLVKGSAVKTGNALLPAVVTPSISFSADKARKAVKTSIGPGGTDLYTDVYSDNIITFTANSSVPVTGTWELDDASIRSTEEKEKYTGDFTNSSSIVIPLKDISDGEHVLQLRGTNANGDGFLEQYVFSVDTMPPRLLINSPVNGSMYETDGSLTIIGVTDRDALLTIETGRGSIYAGKTIEEMGAVIATDGAFKLTVNLPDHNGSSNQTLTITAADAAGNSISRSVELTHGGMASLKELRVLYNGASASYLPPVKDQQTISLSLAGVASDGALFAIDSPHVLWLCQNSEGNASVEQDGTLTLDAGDLGIVSAGLQVSSTAYRTAALPFGFVPDGAVNVISSIGGRVTGGDGTYTPGQPVTLTAIPDSGYEFAGWKLDGAAVSDPNALTITFSYPPVGAVTATASFRAASADEEEPSLYFSDLEGCWAKDSIYYVASRGLFQGIGNNIFDPYGTMTRAMFVTVLYRMAGMPAASGSVSFTDVDMNSWYGNALLWASQNGIITGITNTIFDPEGELTREQLCVLIIRYIEQQGYKLKLVNDALDFKDESSIGGWAASAVDACQRIGLVNGKPGNIFDPKGNATRAENCVIVHRMIKAIQSGNSLN